MECEDKTYWQEEVDHVHQAEDDICDLCLMIAVACEYECASYDMMCEHLYIVLPSLLNMDNHDLLEPESKLDQDVPFR